MCRMHHLFMQTDTQVTLINNTEITLKFVNIQFSLISLLFLSTNLNVLWRRKSTNIKYWFNNWPYIFVSLKLSIYKDPQKCIPINSIETKVLVLPNLYFFKNQIHCLIISIKSIYTISFFHFSFLVLKQWRQKLVKFLCCCLSDSPLDSG